MMYTACFCVGIASTTVKWQNKSVIKNNFLIRGVPSSGLLEEKLYLSVSHARRRAIETMCSSIVQREYLIFELFYCIFKLK
jgi:hypothetical protein